MNFDPSTLNFGATHKLNPRAEASHIAVLERQAQQVARSAPTTVAQQLKSNVAQHHLQRRIARLQQMQQAIAEDASAQRLMQALAFVKTLYTDADAPTDLAFISLLQPILQGLQPKWAALKTQANVSPVLPVDYQRLEKLKQPHAQMSTAERSALFKLLHRVYRAIDGLSASETPASDLKPANTQDLVLRSQLHRASSDREKQRLRAEIAQLENLQQRAYHTQCLRDLEQCQQMMQALSSFGETPRPRVLQHLSKLTQQWQNNRFAEAAYPMVPELLQLAARQLARIGVPDAAGFIQAQNAEVLHRLQSLGVEHALFAPLQAWQGTFAETLSRLLTHQEDLQAAQAFALARDASQKLHAQLEQWPEQRAEIQALEQRLREPAAGSTYAEAKAALLQGYGQILLNLPKIGE